MNEGSRAFEQLVAGQPQARRGSGGEWLILCPYHGERTPSLSVNVIKGVFYCHGCGRTGGSWKLAMELEGISLQQAASKYGGASGSMRWPIDKADDGKLRLPSEFHALPSDAIVAKGPMAYLRSRGITNRQIHESQIGFCWTGYYAGRIIIPVYMEGELMTYVARDFTGTSEKRVKYPKGSKAAKALFGWDRAKRLGAKYAALTEGWADALAVDRAALDKSIAPLAVGGKRLTPDQILALEGFEGFLIMLDRDAMRDAMEMEYDVSIFRKPSIRCAVSGKDPAETDPVELSNFVRAFLRRVA